MHVEVGAGLRQAVGSGKRILLSGRVGCRLRDRELHETLLVRHGDGDAGRIAELVGRVAPVQGMPFAGLG